MHCPTTEDGGDGLYLFISSETGAEVVEAATAAPLAGAGVVTGAGAGVGVGVAVEVTPAEVVGAAVCGSE